jgi:hypothetical protein
MRTTRQRSVPLIGGFSLDIDEIAWSFTTWRVPHARRGTKVYDTPWTTHAGGFDTERNPPNDQGRWIGAVPHEMGADADIRAALFF